MTILTDPAYPVTEGHRVSKGLSKREAFAMAAMQGLLAGDPARHCEPNRIAQWAVDQADALQDALNKEIK